MTDLLTANIGGISFRVTEWLPRGGHYHVAVRGIGPTGNRPLLGTLFMGPEEWAALTDAADRLEAE